MHVRALGVGLSYAIANAAFGGRGIRRAVAQIQRDGIDVLLVRDCHVRHRADRRHLDAGHAAARASHRGRGEADGGMMLDSQWRTDDSAISDRSGPMPAGCDRR